MKTGWTEVALGEVASIVRDVVAPADIADGTMYVGLENIERGGAFRHVIPVKNGDLVSAKFAFDASHILYGKLRPNLGKIARPAFAGVCSTDILPVFAGEHIDRSFLAHFLARPDVVELATRRAAGANLPRLSPTELKRLRVPLPPLNEQQRIAVILDEAETLRRRRHAALTLAQQLPQSFFACQFGDPLAPAPGAPLVCLSDIVQEIRIGPFGSALHRDDYVSGGVPVINPMHISDGAVVADPRFAVSPGKRDELSAYTLRQGDVILGRRGEMGRCAVIGETEEGYVCGTGSMIVRPDPDSADPVYLQAALSSRSARVALERSSVGATLPNLNKGIVGALRVKLPRLAEQRMFARSVAQLESLARAQSAHRKALDALFASLRDRAFAGALLPC